MDRVHIRLFESKVGIEAKHIPSSLRRYRLTNPVEPKTVTVRPLLDDRPPFPYLAKWLNCLTWEAMDFRTADILAKETFSKSNFVVQK